jgi:hypothetical protein
MCWLGLSLAVITTPFFHEAATSTEITLGTMHAITGGIWFLTTRRLAHRRPLPAH